MFVCSETAVAGKKPAGNSKRFTLIFINIKTCLLISLEGEKRQFKKCFIRCIVYTDWWCYFIRRDKSNTAIGSINMTGNTLINVSVPEHDHDAANKLYVDRRSGGTDKVSRSGDSMLSDLDMGGYGIAGLNTSLPSKLLFVGLELLN